MISLQLGVGELTRDGKKTITLASVKIYYVSVCHCSISRKCMREEKSGAGAGLKRPVVMTNYCKYTKEHNGNIYIIGVCV